jgi:hypothetical protein
MQEYRFIETFTDANGHECTVNFNCRASTPADAEAQRDRFRKAYGPRFANSARGMFTMCGPIRA